MFSKSRHLHLPAAAAAALTLLVAAGTAQATAVSGTVYCDANGNQSIDGADTVLPDVEVIVEPGSLSDETNLIGIYFIDLPSEVPAAYEQSLNPATLPADAVIVPGPNLQSFELTPTMQGAIVDWLVDSAVCRASFCGDGIIDEGEQCDDGNNEDGDGCSAVCEDERSEGCTPGYWKQEHHFDSYPTAYSPDTLFADVFEDAFPGKTLVEVMSTGGGGLIALGRHAVAALLNAASDDVAYGISEQAVIDAFNGAYPGGRSSYNQTKNVLEMFNEQECPLN